MLTCWDESQQGHSSQEMSNTNTLTQSENQPLCVLRPLIHQQIFHALTGKRKWSLVPHQMGLALIKRTPKTDLIFSNHHLPILKTDILIHPPVMKKQETKVCKKECWKVTEKTQHGFFSGMWHKGSYVQPGNKIKTVWNFLIPEELSATDKPEKKNTWSDTLKHK